MLHDSPFLVSRRRGVILLVVVSMLTLFAIIGLSFVMYANSEAESSKLGREAQVQFRPEIEPDLLAAFALGQLIYDVPNDETGIYSAMRGHSLARSMYGWNDTPGAVNVLSFNGVGRLNYNHPTTTPPHLYSNQPEQDLINHTFHRLTPAQLGPYQNVIRDPERLNVRPPNPTTPPVYGANNGYAGGYNVPYTYPDRNNMFLAAVRADGSVLMPSFFRPWTFNLPGRENLGFDPANWRWQRDFDTIPANVEPWLRNLVLRPRPADHPRFPRPEDGGGDVKQLIGSPGTLRPDPPAGESPYWTNDSFWMDLNFPVMKTPEGLKYKPLFAFLVTDLDNRVNLNVHSNIKANLPATGDSRYPRRYEHRSHMGFGPWEVNVGKVLPRTIPNSTRPEWNNLFTGDPGRNPTMIAALGWLGRYGTNVRPTTGDSGTVGRMPHFYGPVDFDAAKRRMQGSAASDQLGLNQDPMTGGIRPPYFVFPWLPANSGWDNGFMTTGISDPNEQLDHPLLYSVLNPRGDDRQFAISNMEALLRYADTGTSALTSELFQLCPENFQLAKARGLVTVRSFDVDSPGVVPLIREDTTTGGLEVDTITTPALADNPPAPKGVNFRFPDPLTDAPPFRGEFGADWRALTAALGRIDLNRVLAPYPHQGSGRRPPFGPPLTQDMAGKFDPHGRFDGATAQIAQQQQWAHEDRQRLANDIYRMLLRVTGVRPPGDPNDPQPVELRPRRWLAQLAVNIVDFIDEDEISTPFLFYDAQDTVNLTPAQLVQLANEPTQQPEGNGGDTTLQGNQIQFPKFWVFGTEMPRLLLNEVMVQIDDEQPGVAHTTAQRIRTFAELHNPFPTTVPPSLQQTVQRHDFTPVPLRIGTGATSFSPYQIMVAADDRDGPQFRSTILPEPDNDNVLGCPRVDHVKCATRNSDFALPTILKRSGNPQGTWMNPQFADIASPYVPTYNVGNPTDTQGMFLLGPAEIAAGGTGQDATLKLRDPYEGTYDASIPDNTPHLRAPGLEYSRTFAAAPPNDERTNGVVVLLRRLANPHLPFDGRRIVNTGMGDQINPNYNPYVTIDYLDQIDLSGTRPGVTELFSKGKTQPFAAFRTYVPRQNNGNLPNGLHFTFGSLNRANPDPMHTPDPYDWLIHYDRQLVSHAELLHVSGYQPYKLTQRFMVDPAVEPDWKFAHRARWFDEGIPAADNRSHRLYRALEFLSTGSRATGVAPGGRIPGKININTIWDEETLQALFDEQPSNHFPDQSNPGRFTRDRVWRKIQGDPAVFRTTRPDGIPSEGDKPFGSFATGKYEPGPQFPDGGGPTASFLRLQRDLSAGGHPYEWYEALNKVANQITNRSNVFAVWVTVGFFEVEDDTTRPVRLGAEVGKAENRHVRPRFFSIVDRTNLSIATDVAHLRGSVPPQPAGQIPGTYTVPVSDISGTFNGQSWQIQAGSTILVDVGDRQEAVVVTAVTPGVNPTITATFTKRHDRTTQTPVSLPNIPGAPPIFLKSVKVESANNPSSPHQYWITVPYQRLGTNPTSLIGEYDGLDWAISANARLIVGTGANQEMVRVQAVADANNPPGTYQTPHGKFLVTLTPPYPTTDPRFLLWTPPEPLTISNTLLGNPGPQPRFNPREAPFSAIVRYLSVIQ